jgi:hypothetical protein
MHHSQFIADHISEIEILIDDKQIYKGKIPAAQFISEKSYMPNLVEEAVYLRTECIENAVHCIDAEIENFDISKLKFLTQDYELIFKIGKEFVTQVQYDGKQIELQWQSGIPVGNICLLCGFQSGHLVPIYDAVSKKYA